MHLSGHVNARQAFLCHRETIKTPKTFSWKKRESRMLTLRKNFEFDGVYFSGYSINVIEAFFHGNFKTNSLERDILDDGTILTAFEKIKQDQNIMQSLVKLHT